MINMVLSRPFCASECCRKARILSMVRSASPKLMASGLAQVRRSGSCERAQGGAKRPFLGSLKLARVRRGHGEREIDLGNGVVHSASSGARGVVDERLEVLGGLAGRTFPNAKGGARRSSGNHRMVVKTLGDLLLFNLSEHAGQKLLEHGGRSAQQLCNKSLPFSAESRGSCSSWRSRTWTHIRP